MSAPEYHYDGPLTAADLRVAADALDVIESVPALGTNRGIGRIEAIVDDSQIGWFTRFDDDPDAAMGWGFIT